MVVVRSAKDGLIEIFLYHMSEYSDKDERKTDSNLSEGYAARGREFVLRHRSRAKCVPAHTFLFHRKFLHF